MKGQYPVLLVMLIVMIGLCEGITMRGLQNINPENQSFNNTEIGTPTSHVFIDQSKNNNKIGFIGQQPPSAPPSNIVINKSNDNERIGRAGDNVILNESSQNKDIGTKENSIKLRVKHSNLNGNIG